MKSQNEAVLKHLKSGRAITPMLALEKYGIMRLGARIFNLRRAGHPIITTPKNVTNRYGVECRIASYSLE